MLAIIVSGCTLGGWYLENLPSLNFQKFSFTFSCWSLWHMVFRLGLCYQPSRHAVGICCALFFFFLVLRVRIFLQMKNIYWLNWKSILFLFVSFGFSFSESICCFMYFFFFFFFFFFAFLFLLFSCSPFYSSIPIKLKLIVFILLYCRFVYWF